MSDVTIDMIQNNDGQFTMKPSLQAVLWKGFFKPALKTIAKASALPIRNKFIRDIALKTVFTTATLGILMNDTVDFYYDDAGNQRNSINYAFNIAHDNAQSSEQAIFYQASTIAMSHGVHPLAPLLIAAKETGLNPYFGGDSKDAQGPYQMQALYFIESIRNYARDTQFYQGLADNDIRHMAIDSILNDRNLNNDDRRLARAIQLDNDFETGDFNPDSLDAEFLVLRNDFQFATELISLWINDNHPEMRIENIPTNIDDAIEHIAQAMGAMYSEHMMGPTGSAYLFALAEHYPDLTIADADAVQAAANQIQEQEGFFYPFNALRWIAGADQNRGIFRDGAQTRLGDLPNYFAQYGREQTSTVFSTLETIAQVSEQSFIDYIMTGDNVVESFFTPAGQRAVEFSNRPEQRPDRVDAETSNESLNEFGIRPTPNPQRPGLDRS